MERNILLAEDDENTAQLLNMYLTAEGYRVFTARDGQNSLDILHESRIDLLVADMMLPGMDEYELIRTVRKESTVPVIVVSEKKQDSDKVLGLNIGADVYITKPFNPMEVVAYVNALIRREYEFRAKERVPEEPSDSGNGLLRVGELELDTRKLELTKRGEPVFLTPAELKILMQLMQAPGRVFTKTQLYECVNGEYFENTDNTMMVHIANLRSKIEDDPSDPVYIRTIRGLGYKMEDPDLSGKRRQHTENSLNFNKKHL